MAPASQFRSEGWTALLSHFLPGDMLRSGGSAGGGVGLLVALDHRALAGPARRAAEHLRDDRAHRRGAREASRIGSKRGWLAMDMAPSFWENFCFFCLGGGGIWLWVTSMVPCWGRCTTHFSRDFSGDWWKTCNRMQRKVCGSSFANARKAQAYCGWLRNPLRHHRSEILVCDDSPVNTKKLWFPMAESGAKWIPSIHSIGKPSIRCCETFFICAYGALVVDIPT